MMRALLRHPQFERVVLAFILLLGLVLRFAAITLYAHTPESDELAYQAMARNLVAGQGIIDSMGNYAMYSVGYPLFILAPLYALGFDSVGSARSLHALLGGVAIVLVWELARSLGLGRRGRLLSAAGWALYLPASVYTVYLCKEHLLIPLVLLLLISFQRFQAAPNLRRAAIIGLLIGLIALTGNAALSLLSCAGFVWWFASKQWTVRWQSALVAGLAALVIVSPWMIRNALVLGTPLLNTNGGFNLYLGNNPAATGQFVSIADTPRGPTWEALRQGGEAEASATLQREALQWIVANPARFVELSLRKAGFFWAIPLHDGRGQMSGAERMVRVAWAIQFIVFVALAVVGLVSGLWRHSGALFLCLALLSYTGVHMLFLVILRYREPIMPALVVLAVMGFEAMLLRWPGREHTK